jgi:hypothetical protein
MRQKRYDSTEEQNWIGIPSHQELWSDQWQEKLSTSGVG